MPVYSVHEPPLRKRETSIRKDDVLFVRDGFHFWAFLLGPIWIIWNGLWLVLIFYAAGTTLVHIAAGAAGAGRSAHFWLSVLIAILVGLEAATLRRWTLSRRGYRQIGVVVGDDAELAERRFFDEASEREEDLIPPRARGIAPPPPPRSMPQTPQSDIVGHFPHYEPRR